MNAEIKSAVFRVLPFAIILIVVLVRLKQKKVNPDVIALHRPFSWKRFFLCTTGFLTFILLSEFVLFQFGLLETNPWDHPPLASVIRILGAVILAPVVEEILFRGFILNFLHKKMKLHLAVFLQAVFFVLLHNFAYENTVGSNIGIVQSMLDAVLFGYARFYTKSLYTPMAMHITGNFVATLERFIL